MNEEQIRNGHLGKDLRETLIRDIRHGIRSLLKQPGFTLIAVLTLALGVGANTAIFSVIDALVLRKLPVRNPEQLVALGYTVGGEHENFSYPMFEKLRDGLPASTFSSVSAVTQMWRSNLTVDNDSQSDDALVGLASGNYFVTLGVNPLVGRTLIPDDDRVPGGDPVTVISYDYWRRRLNLDPNVLNSSLKLQGTTYTIVGVMPPGFSGDWVGRSTDLWIPLAMTPQVYTERPDSLANQNQGWLRIIARLNSGVSAPAAQAAAEVVWHRAISDSESTHNPSFRQRYAQSRFALEPYARGYSQERERFAPALLVLMLMVGLVLLIACANMASFLLARSVARRKEMALRAALGARPARIVQQLLIENMLLSIAGGALGLLFAIRGTEALVRFLSSAPQSRNLGPLAFQLNVRPDARVLGFTAVVSLLTGLLFGLAPACRGARLSLVSAFGGRGSEGSTSFTGRFGLSKGLVIAQVAVSLLLLICAGLFMRTLRNLNSQDLGFDRQHVLLVWTSPGQSGRSGPELANFYQMAQERVSALPGVLSASPSMKGLLRDNGYSVRVRVSGMPTDDSDSPHFDLVAPRFFETVGMRLLMGRDFSARDTETAPHVAIVNQYTARLFFGDQNPIGKTFGAAMMGRDAPFYQTEIVGVVNDVKGNLSLRETDRRMIYFPYRQDLALNTHPRLTQMCLTVRTIADPARLKASIREELRRIDSNLPIAGMESVSEQLSESVAQERMIATLSASFASLAVFLACLGLYGVISYTVAHRTNEIGIRLALGATPRDVLRMILKESLWLVLTGFAIGVPVTLGTKRLISTTLFGIGAVDPLTFAGAMFLMVAVAAFAVFFPARRATKVDPLVALRYE